MKIVRILILKTLGLKKYLKIVSTIYLLIVKRGFLKQKYPELFFLKNIIKSGDVCIDIGANLGYYSTFMSEYCGKEGFVYAVEPVKLFAEIWNKNLNKSTFNNYKLLPYALGGEKKAVKMGMPKVNGVIHHGMTKIASTANQEYVEYFDVEMRIPDELFSSLTKLNFIKCDVEGFESNVFLNMRKIIEKFRPIVQSELSGMDNRKQVIDLFRSFDYEVKILINNKLAEATEKIINNTSNDFYFYPKSN